MSREMVEVRVMTAWAIADWVRRGNARGDGAGYRAERRRWTPIVAAGITQCWRCGKRIEAGEPWTLGSDASALRFSRPQHADSGDGHPGPRWSGDRAAPGVPRAGHYRGVGAVPLLGMRAPLDLADAGRL